MNLLLFVNFLLHYLKGSCMYLILMKRNSLTSNIGSVFFFLIGFTPELFVVASLVLRWLPNICCLVFNFFKTLPLTPAKCCWKWWLSLGKSKKTFLTGNCSWSPVKFIFSGFKGSTYDRSCQQLVSNQTSWKMGKYKKC